MKTKYFILAAVAGMTLASCSSDEFVGDLSPSPSQVTNDTEAINFGFDLTNMTRGNIYGNAAATLLGNHFYVTGTKGTEPATSPTTNLVFDNYLVRYTANTAGTTESNTANWEYVGVVPGTAPDADYVKLSALNTQTIKYWDYSTDQYDFFGFSTGTHKAVNSTTPAAGEIGVTSMAYGNALANNGTAYTFYIPDEAAIKNAYITDITEVMNANYGKEVTLRFKNLGSKVRIALYETVPGYSVKDVVFYKVDGTTAFTDGDENPENDEDLKSTTAVLISADDYGIPTKGSIAVYFPHVGVNNSPQATGTNTPKADYDIAAATVSPTTASSVKFKGFGTLENQLTGKDPAGYEDNTNNVYLGRSFPNATYAGDVDADFYQTVFPVSTGAPLTLRVDYTLVAIDGSGETINVYGAKAVVPSTYTKWLPNYAYTYVFKISDNTNGWTTATGATTENQGLFPITFDAVVAEATDATAEQATITTVATPSITTYQQNHDIKKNEYSKATGKNIYVQVMENSTTTPALVTTLSNDNSLLYSLDAEHLDATEAQVMDALQKRTVAYDASAASVTGRNGITLTNQTIDNSVTQILNGADDNPIELTTAGKAAMIDITTTGTGLAAGTYAYVYDYTTGNRSLTEVNEFQPIVLSEGKVGVTGKNYKSLAITDLNTQAATSTNFTVDESASNPGEAVNNAYIYFSKTENGTGTTTYSYVSVAGKDRVPAGLLKYPKASITTNVDGGSNGDTDHFYFDTYFTNTGLYAVKVIKIVAS